jgi:hypothetical protein
MDGVTDSEGGVDEGGFEDGTEARADEGAA